MKPATPLLDKPAGTTGRDWVRKLEEREQKRRADVYPQLVAALRNAANVLNANGGPTKAEREEGANDSRALLRSIGEAS